MNYEMCNVKLIIMSLWMHVSLWALVIVYCPVLLNQWNVTANRSGLEPLPLIEVLKSLVTPGEG